MMEIVCARGASVGCRNLSFQLTSQRLTIFILDGRELILDEASWFHKIYKISAIVTRFNLLLFINIYQHHQYSIHFQEMSIHLCSWAVRLCLLSGDARWVRLGLVLIEGVADEGLVSVPEIILLMIVLASFELSWCEDALSFVSGQLKCSTIFVALFV